MLIAESWYESGSFWQFVITTLAAVALGALGAWATMRASNPKRRLDYSTLTNAPLFIASHSQTGALQVTHHGTVVNRPRIVELELRNAGRHDITAAQFHGGQSLKVELGANVVGLLAVKSTPATTLAPSVGIDAASSQTIVIPPALLVRKQAVRVTILVDGPKRDVTIQAPLISVAVREGNKGEQLSRHIDRLAPALLVAVVSLVVGNWYR
ncbi:hypothetical protein [Streptomyces griseoluteus]|uniref:hypothetical protein n=1 Tax=Streptomyces griseoluteus TaxID=29306 RepID=UPI00343BBA81